MNWNKSQVKVTLESYINDAHNLIKAVPSAFSKGYSVQMKKQKLATIDLSKPFHIKNDYYWLIDSFVL